MVSCHKVMENLSALLDGDIDPNLRRDIENHLNACRRCNVVHDSLRKVAVVVADERIFEIPVGYMERLHKFLDQHLWSV